MCARGGEAQLQRSQPSKVAVSNATLWENHLQMSRLRAPTQDCVSAVVPSAASFLGLSRVQCDVCAHRFCGLCALWWPT